jgi:hypothetical protein
MDFDYIIKVIPIPKYNINSNNFNVTQPIYDNSFNYNHTGNYSITSSSYYKNFKPYNAFNKVGLNNSIPWVCDSSNSNTITTNYTPYSQPPYYNSNNSEINCSYQGGGNKNGKLKNYWETIIKGGKDLSNSTIAGEWIQIKIPTLRNESNTIYLYNYSILTPIPTNGIYTFPTKFMIVGSKDGETWNYVDQRNLSIIDTTNQEPIKFNINSIESYSYFRLIIIEMPPQNYFVSISNWQLNFVPILKYNPETFTNMNTNYDYFHFTSNKMVENNHSTYAISKPLENEQNEQNKKIEEHIFFNDNQLHNENIITPFLIFILAISLFFYYKNK